MMALGGERETMAMDDSRKTELLQELVSSLIAERRGDPSAFGEGCDLPEGTGDASVEELWHEFRGLVNTREPLPASADLLERQDELLQGLIDEAGIHTIDEALVSPMDPRLRLWCGDITTLAADTIVNAANSKMTGCWAPNHLCIDNAIHTFAGMQLRRECAEMMAEQGREEPTGMAKITGAWNLPCKRVIHTVGPIANGKPTDEDRRLLVSSYTSCLDLALQNGMRSVAFCCISTGVFGFPQQEAAEIAVDTVYRWLKDHDGRITDAKAVCSDTSDTAFSEEASLDMTVIFDVFGDTDERIYRELLGIPLLDVPD